MAGQDVTIKVGVEMAGAVKSLDKLQKEMKETAQASKASGRALDAGMSKGERAIAELRGEMSKAGASLERLKAKTDAAAASTRKATDATTAAKSSIGGLVTGLISLAGLREGVRQVFQAFEDVQRFDALEAGLKALAADLGGSEAAMKAVQGATRGMVSEMEAMKIANVALSAHVVKSVQELEQFTEQAIVLGRAVGLDAAESVEKFTRAMSQQSPELLEHLGITLKVSTAQRIYAQQLKKTTSELTATEKEQAFATVAMQVASERVEELGGFTGNAADEYGRLQASAADVKIAFQKLFVREFHDEMQFWSDTMRDVADAMGFIGASSSVNASLFSDPWAQAAAKVRNAEATLQDFRDTLATMQADQKRGALLGPFAVKQEDIDRTVEQIERWKYALTGLRLEENRLRAERGKTLPVLNAEAEAERERLAAAQKAAAAAAEAAKKAREAAQKEAEALRKRLQAIDDVTDRLPELAAQVKLVTDEEEEQRRIYLALKKDGESAISALESLWRAGLIAPELYAEKVDEIRVKLGELAEVATGPLDLGAFAGFGRPEGFEGAGGFAGVSREEGLSRVTPEGFQGLTAGGLTPEQAELQLETLAGLRDGTLELAEATERLLAANIEMTPALEARMQAEALHAGIQKTNIQLENMMFGALRQTAGAMIAGALSGEISMRKIAKAVASSIAQQAGVEAIMEVARGLQDLAASINPPNPVAAAAAKVHFLAAKKFGIVAGIAGGIAVAAGGGEGGGGSGGAAGDTGTARDTTRTVAAADEAEDQGPRTTVIIESISGIVGNEEEAGRAISEIVERAVARAGGSTSQRGG